MDNRTAELLSAASGGATFGVWSGVTLFKLSFTAMIFPYEFAMKLLGTCMLAGVGGIAGMFFRDFYTYWIKPKIKSFNPKKNTDVGETQ